MLPSQEILRDFTRPVKTAYPQKMDRTRALRSPLDVETLIRPVG